MEPLPAPRYQVVPARTVLRPGDISPDFTPTLGEVDVVGLVVYVHHVTGGSSALQTVYLTDTGHDFFGLVFWRGLQVKSEWSVPPSRTVSSFKMVRAYSWIESR